MRQVHGQETAGEMLRRAAEFAEQGQSRQAAEAATQAIELQPDLADAYYLRGREHFRLGEVEKSVADFEKLVQLRPRRAASLWELGISYYYAG
ncbi:MAG: tetratricopeptide repeat protein [Planctomycetes bacterium]|nr:tetratricopeptide repeat protein [Planctomycetota bacterium]